MSVYVIKSEDDAWRLLELLRGDDDFPYKSLKVEEWRGFQIKLHGEKFHSSITTDLFEPIKKLESNLLSSYALLTKGIADARRVSKADKERLRLVIKVGEGSTILDPNPKDAVNAIIEGCINKMDSKHLLIAVLSVVLGFFGTTAWDSYLQTQLEARRIEAQDAQSKAFLEHLEFASEQEMKRMQILREMASENDVARHALRSADEAHKSLLKSLRSVPRAEFGENNEITDEIASELSKSATEDHTETRMDGIYQVKRLSSNDLDSFTIIVYNQDIEFSAQIDSLLNRDKEVQDVLNSAFWSHEFLKLKINAKLKDGQIISAIIVGLSKNENPE